MKIQHTCHFCKNTFQDYLCNHKKFCSRRCADAVKKMHTWEKNYNWKWGNVILSCLECKTQFFVRPHRKHIAKFCSHACEDKNRDQGKSTNDKRIRKSIEYKLWRSAVFQRDKYQCMNCGVHSGCWHTVCLQADHIRPFALFPELRFNVENGRTLCLACHKKTETYGRCKMFRSQFLIAS